MSLQPVLERIGRQVAEHQDDAGPRLAEARGLERFRDAVDKKVVRAPRRWRWLAAACVATLSILVVVFAWPRASLTYAVAEGPNVALAEWTDAHENTTVKFSDGTQVSALTGSRWRVSATTPVGATLQLERGELTADVRSLSSSKWLVDAGPFSIRVTGTRFATSWDPVDEVFELQMHEGSVVLAGPVVGGQREVRAPEHLRIEVGRKNLSVVASDAASTSTVAPTAAAATSSAEVAPAAPAPTVVAPEVASWVGLAQAGKHAEALALLRDMNLSNVIASESAAGLLLLSQTARLAGDHALAGRALASLAARFPDSVHGKTAQFLEGKLHFDQGRHAEAVAKLSAYLSSTPRGAFAGEAQVLLILALHHGGRTSEARALAEPYLERHPNGPHAARIRSILPP